MKRIHLLIALLMIGGSAMAQRTIPMKKQPVYVGTYVAPVEKAKTGPAILETPAGALRIPNLKKIQPAAQSMTLRGRPARVITFNIVETINKLNKLAKLGETVDPFFNITRMIDSKTGLPIFMLQLDKAYLPGNEYSPLQGWGPKYVGKPVDMGDKWSFQLAYEVQ